MRHRATHAGSLFYAILYWPCYVIFRCGVRLHVKGARHLPREGGVLMVCNHVGLTDPPLLAVSVRRQLHFMAKRELLASPVWGPLLRALNVYAVKRGEADRAALRLTEQILADGHVVVIFPEGHRSPDVALKRPREGVAFLARRANAPIVPVAIFGSEHVTPRTIWRRPHVHVVVGKPFRLEELEAEGRQQIAHAIMERIAVLLPPRYRGIYRDDVPVEADSTLIRDSHS